MNLADVLSAASDAVALLAAHPVRWIAIVVVVLIAVESLMLVPYAGFVLKLAVAGVVFPLLVALFAAAAQGRAPTLLGLAEAMTFSPGTIAVLAGASLLPFAAGLLALHLEGGWPAIEFFFGNIFRSQPPSPAHGARLKIVSTLAGLPFTFLAGAVVVKGLDGVAALSAALSAAVVHWLPIVLLAALALSFEWLTLQLPAVLPKAAAVTVGIVLLIGYLTFSLAMAYTVSAKAFRTTAAPAA